MFVFNEGPEELNEAPCKRGMSGGPPCPPSPRWFALGDPRFSNGLLWGRWCVMEAEVRSNPFGMCSRGASTSTWVAAQRTMSLRLRRCRRKVVDAGCMERISGVTSIAGATVGTELVRLRTALTFVTDASETLEKDIR